MVAVDGRNRGEWLVTRRNSSKKFKMTTTVSRLACSSVSAAGAAANRSPSWCRSNIRAGPAAVNRALCRSLGFSARNASPCTE
jgi:hypothetical protein